jgi:hypothetical protein
MEKIPSIKLEDKAMLVNLSIGVWGATKADKEVSQDTNRRWEAKERAGKYRKNLAENAFSRTKSVRNRARLFHQTHTLPWEDDNDSCRLLPSKNFWKYMGEIKKYEREFAKALINDIEEWPMHITKASRTLGKMFKREDYPTPLEVKRKFHFRVNVYPIPTTGGFASFIQELGQEAVLDIQTELEKRLQDSATSAFRHITTNFYELINDLITKLQDPGFTPKAGMLDSLTKYALALPAIDFTENKDLAQLRQEVETKLCKLNTDSLRHNNTERVKATAIAQDILDKMGAFWGNKEK